MKIAFLLCAWTLSQAQSLQILPAPPLDDASGSFQIMLVSPEGSGPAALQWRITTTGGVEIEDVAVASAADRAGKSIYCAAKEGGRLCLVVGGVQRIPNGAVAVVRFKRTGGHKVTAILIEDALGATPEGDPVPLNDVKLVLRETRLPTRKVVGQGRGQKGRSPARQ